MLAFIAVSLFDMTVKVFFEDSLKFHLSFYGHKLPVTTLDFSHDCKFLLTGSHDKNVKLWAMEFGDCRRSLFAHNEPIQSVRFTSVVLGMISSQPGEMVSSSIGQ